MENALTAFLESLEAKDATKNGWKSNYREEILKIHSKCKVGNIMGNDRSPLQNVVKAVENYTEDILASELSQHRMHSLKYLPDHPSVGVQNYLDGSDASITLTKFRMGNARLGNRSTPQIKVCPTCNNGPNNELHLTNSSTNAFQDKVLKPKEHILPKLNRLYLCFVNMKRERPSLNA